MTHYTWSLNDFQLQCGIQLPQITLAYATYGTLSPQKDNLILYPTSYGAQHPDLEWLIRPDGILNPQRWFILIPNMLGNGLSTSPSNDPACGLREDGFWFSHWDNVRLQESLIRQHFGIERIRLIYGWSMGAQQAYHWGSLFPERVERIVALCGTAKTTVHNRVFLESLRSALTADPAWNGRRFTGVPERGLRAFAHIYASWAVSQPFFNQKCYESLGYASLEDYLERGWEANYRRRDPQNLLSMIETWIRCDISDNPIHRGDYRAALRAIQAQTLVMPAQTDLYFTPEDCRAEAEWIPNAVYKIIPSIWGHRAGNPHQNPEDEAFIRTAVQEFLES
ncbi:alpha/beta fold hydrolase [Synechococcus sp. R55.6]|jgi:homoserine O-acetyltransferase|uniref:alpha/beta fold hydrolase n=1 Tax=unclassified Synechococcus TaxID=2626047 RepID=UPI0039C2BB26